MAALQMSVSNEKNKKEMKNLFLYSTGKTVSIFGTAIYDFTLALYVLKQTGSALPNFGSMICCKRSVPGSKHELRPEKGA